MSLFLFFALNNKKYSRMSDFRKENCIFAPLFFGMTDLFMEESQVFPS